MSGETITWHLRAVERCRRGLTAATAAADRLALLRSFTRLMDGRLDLAAEGVALSPEERGALSRFGLAIAGDGRALRILPEADDKVPGLSAALRLDMSDRRLFEPAAGDGILLRLTGYPTYQSEAQKAAVRALLTQPPGSGLMVSMPTGSGKSLLFQIAALHGRESSSGACAFVITPTIALALDHARTLSRLAGLEQSRALTGDTPPAEAQVIVDAFRRGEVPILLLSPEKALGGSLLRHLIEAASPNSPLLGLDARLTHVFVDEAHIIESWGRSFRPDFQRLPALLAELRVANPAIRAVLLSATLPPAARRVLRQSWRFDGEWLEVDARIPRYDHDVVVAAYDDATPRDEALDHLLDRAPRPAIVYTTEVQHARRLHDHLSRSGGYRRLALFTGESRPNERRQVVERWAQDQLDLVVATSAFGMGIDKPDVRSVVHACLPEGPARWYQEIGRASRDGGQGLAACLFVEGPRNSDVSSAYALATGGWLTRELAEARWAELSASATDRRWEDGRQRMSVNLDAVREGLRRQESDYNRGWNMSLLTLMQRAGAIQVRSVPSAGDQPGSVWELEIMDPRILDRAGTEAWDKVFELRNGEISEARALLGPFVSTMTESRRACVTRTVFELIEPTAFAPPCGRCPACRVAEIPPPEGLLSAGMERAWTAPALVPRRLPPGLLLVSPQDAGFGAGLEKLLSRLASAGVEQFLLPRSIAAEGASILSRGTGLGLIVDVMAMTAQTALARRATAFLLPPDGTSASFVLARLSAFAAFEELPIMVVAEPDRRLSGRRLDQTVSKSAPIPESLLESFVAGGAGAA
ncbi:MAG TPA: DEAD/DEAH box helicase [Allosphingosinicella sp.]